MGELRGESFPQTQRACSDWEMMQLEPDGLFEELDWDLSFRGEYGRRSHLDSDFFWSRFVMDLESWGLRPFFFKYFKVSRGAMTDSFGFLPPSLDATPVFFLSFNMNIF